MAQEPVGIVRAKETPVSGYVLTWIEDGVTHAYHFGARDHRAASITLRFARMLDVSASLRPLTRPPPTPTARSLD